MCKHAQHFKADDRQTLFGPHFNKFMIVCAMCSTAVVRTRSILTHMELQRMSS